MAIISIDKMMSMIILIVIIIIALLLESYSMAIEKEMFAIQEILNPGQVVKMQSTV